MLITFILFINVNGNGGKLNWYNFDCILCYSNYDKISNLILLLEIEPAYVTAILTSALIM